MRAVTESAGFEKLDECHRLIHENLKELAALAQHIESAGVDALAKQKAGAIEAFFSSTSRQHHADEEKNVFPPLLSSDKPELVNAVRTLQQDHGWIEENWIELAPQLRAIADGNMWTEAEEFQHCVQVFSDLCGDHIALEESLIYPESKALWAQLMAKRTQRAQPAS